ncbi:MAG: hypothetical protein QM594_13720 [Niabella sp.]
MKKKLFVAALISCLVVATVVYAQSGTNAGSKYQYCEFIFEVNTKNGQTTRSGTIWYGNGKKEKHNDFYSGLNYLGAAGWELCTSIKSKWDESYEYYTEYGSTYTYTFKKKL